MADSPAISISSEKKHMDSTDTHFEPDMFNFLVFGIFAVQWEIFLVAWYNLLYEP